MIYIKMQVGDLLEVKPSSNHENITLYIVISFDIHGYITVYDIRSKHIRAFGYTGMDWLSSDMYARYINGIKV